MLKLLQIALLVLALVNLNSAYNFAKKYNGRTIKSQFNNQPRSAYGENLRNLAFQSGKQYRANELWGLRDKLKSAKSHDKGFKTLRMKHKNVGIKNGASPLPAFTRVKGASHKLKEGTTRLAAKNQRYTDFVHGIKNDKRKLDDAWRVGHQQLLAAGNTRYINTDDTLSLDKMHSKRKVNLAKEVFPKTLKRTESKKKIDSIVSILDENTKKLDDSSKVTKLSSANIKPRQFGAKNSPRKFKITKGQDLSKNLKLIREINKAKVMNPESVKNLKLKIPKTSKRVKVNIKPLNPSSVNLKSKVSNANLKQESKQIEKLEKRDAQQALLSDATQ